MSSTFFRTVLFAIVTTSVGVISAANAQKVSPDTAPGSANASSSPQSTGHVTAADSSVLEEITVTAQKREENINKVGLTIAAIGASTLQEQNIQSLADIAQVVPGLSYTNSANNTPVYTLRGVGFYDTSLGSYPTTSIYLDQAPLPFPVQSALTAFDLERIEVLKGPQGTLFGQNSTGGAINYIARKPTNEFSAGAVASYGTFNDFIEDAYVSGPIGDGVRVRLALRDENSGAWQYSYTRNDTNGRAHQLAGRLLVDWDASSTLKFQLNVNGWQDKSDPLALQYVAFNQQAISNAPAVEAYPRSPLTSRAADWSPDNGMFIHRNLNQTVLRADWEFVPDITLTSITSYVGFNERGALDQDGIALSDLDLRYFSGDIHSFAQEVRLANANTGRFRSTIGANFSSDTVSYDENIVYANSSATQNYGIHTSENYSNQHMTNIAGFASGEYDILSSLTAKAGVRYTESRRSATICNHDGGDGLTAALFTVFAGALSGQSVAPLGINDCFALNAQFLPGTYYGKLTEDNVSWRTGLDYRATDHVLLYVNVAKGFKAGTFGNLNASSQVQYVPAVQESILSYEGGAKAQFLDRRLSINGALFYMDYTNKQLRSKRIDPTFGIIDVIVNIPKSHIQGAEVEINALPARGLSVGLAATYIDSKIDQYSGVNAGGLVANFAGSAIPFTPSQQYGGNARYEYPVMQGISAFISAQLTYRSKTNAIVGGTADYNIDAYGLLDAQLGLASQSGWKAMLWGKNITNRYYWTNVVAGQDTIDRYPEKPATFGVSVGYTF